MKEFQENVWSGTVDQSHNAKYYILFVGKSSSRLFSNSLAIYSLPGCTAAVVLPISLWNFQENL